MAVRCASPTSLPSENPFWWVRQRGSHYREERKKKIKWVKTFPTAFLQQPLSPSRSLLECVWLLLRFKFWHFEINRRQRDVFSPPLLFFFLQFHGDWVKTLQSGLQRTWHRRRRDRSIMSGALPGVPLKACLFSTNSNPAAIPSTFTD